MCKISFGVASYSRDSSGVKSLAFKNEIIAFFSLYSCVNSHTDGLSAFNLWDSVVRVYIQALVLTWAVLVKHTLTIGSSTTLLPAPAPRWPQRSNTGFPTNHMTETVRVVPRNQRAALTPLVTHSSLCHVGLLVSVLLINWRTDWDGGRGKWKYVAFVSSVRSFTSDRAEQRRRWRVCEQARSPRQKIEEITKPTLRSQHVCLFTWMI